MTTLAHALSGGIVAVTAAGIAPEETGYLVVAVLAGAAVDADHFYPVLRDWKYYREHGFRGNLHAARTPLHELAGLNAAGVVAGLLWTFDARLAVVVFAAFSVHLAQDFVMGRSLPFSPLDRTEVQMFEFGFRTKMMVDVFTLALSGLLWYLFLNGRL